VPTWGQILEEIKASAAQRAGSPDFDSIRRKYLRQLHALTERDTILYATDWVSGTGKPGVSITLEDMQGLMEVCKDLRGPALDIILNSPGGSAEATASIVRYLREKYRHIRVFVPLAAMSAATMWALAADEIVMGKHSQLGPIDPQLVTPQGQYPARAILEQFDKAKQECARDPSLIGAWLPILQQYGPSLLEQCEQAEALARRLARAWLAEYMFRDDPRRSAKARRAADYFADYSKHRSHAMGVGREEARRRGLRVVDLESDQALQDAVLSVHHATVHTFQGAAAKIIENHLGRAFVKVAQPIQVNLQAPQVSQPA
jgi:hypothetical protein